jgi:hydrogenase-4 membrane subunit HyfE
MNIGTIFQACAGALLLTSVLLHLVKKNSSEVKAYTLQSVTIVGLIITSAIEQKSVVLGLVALATLVVKVLLAPSFFDRLIRHNQIKFSVSSYLNLPLTLLTLATIFVLTQSHIFAPLANIVPNNHTYLVLALTSMFVSIFLMVNRKGVLSQIAGILSLENSIVAFAIFAGLEQSPTLQLGILFDILVWVVIATVFVSMIYRHFGSLDITNMKNLKG